ncbi:MAG: membrane protein insertase YidC [Phycisphaerales bacterium]|nr:membrane protein insertase YidC [Phycisphaerales bacterium]MBT7170931.1 membrane protein insertase YidC [Phycisphaerales bacterium]
MEQLKSLFTTLLIFGLIFMAFQYFMGSDDAPKADSPKRQALATTVDTLLANVKTPQTATLGSLDPSDPAGYKMQVNLTAAEAAIESTYLTNFYQTVALKRQAAKGETPKEIGEGHYKLLSPVQVKNTIHRSMATREMQIVQDATGVDELAYMPKWRLASQSETADKSAQSAVFEVVVRQGGRADTQKYLTLRKTYTLRKNSHSLEVSLDVTNETGEEIKLTLDQLGPLGMTSEDLRSDMRESVSGLRADGVITPKKLAASALDDLGEDNSLFETYLPNKAKPYFMKRRAAWEEAGMTADEAEEHLKDQYFAYRLDKKKTDDGMEKLDVVWTGMANKFFASYLYLIPPKGSKSAIDSYNVEYFAKPIKDLASKEAEKKTPRAWMGVMKFRDLTIAPDATVTMKMDLFCGPKLRTLFSANPLYGDLQYASSVTTKNCFCTWEWLVRGLMWLLGVFAMNLFFGNYGLAIILLVLIVRACLHPLTKKSQISMATMQKKMAILKPKLDAIKEKYKKDPRKQQQEMMRLNKEHGVGAAQMLGCLPMFIQMPIWIALFSGLNTEVALRHAQFLPVWITDLSVPDALFVLPASLQSSFVGNTFNLLPLLLCFAMYLQSKLNPAMSSTTASPEQKVNQNMMKIMMPVMMLMFFYKAPSGLCLYIMASTFAGVLEQVIIRKHIREQEEMAPEAGDVVVATGRGPRGTRPKKSKSPFQVKK